MTDWDDRYDDDDEAELLKCPSCGREVYEETQQCPYCGDWITPHAAHAGLPLWVRWAALMLLLAIGLGLARGLLHWF